MEVVSGYEPGCEPLSLLTVREAVALLRVSDSWIYAAARDGRIPCVRIGGPDGPVRFVREDLLAHIEAARNAWRPDDRAGAALARVSRRRVR